MGRTQKADVAIIGGGPAGLAAASEAKAAGADRVLLLERDARVGGILNQQVHDGFGTKVFNEALTGPEYAAIYEDRCNERDVETWLKSTVINVTKDRVLTVQSDSGLATIEASSMIFAMGCRERTRGAIGTPGTRPAGVFTAGAVQNYMNVRNLAVGRKVVILGSGDIGLIMARRMTLEGAEVICVAEILPQPSGIAGNIVRCLEDFNIPLYLSTTVVEIHGKERVTGVTLAQVGPKMGEVYGTRRFIECDTLLLSVGLIPETELSTEVGIATNPVTTGAVVDDSFRTSVPGIFSCGNVLQVHDVVDFATLEAEKAGRAAAMWATTGELPEPTISITPGEGLRYVLPAAISGVDAVDFTMRSWKEEHHKSVVFRSGGEVLRRLKMPHMEPAGMIRVRVGQGRFKKVLDKNITVEVGE
ncbi:MAG: FAD-dependent oxidoreductase [Chloroflexi bacterium]|nr:FAD-dependent oxidoreductase [Chloroflexota bacterium]